MLALFLPATVMSASLLELVWVVTVLITTLSFAQNDTAPFPPCTDDSLKWSFNEKDRSPCDVTQALYLVCTPDGGPLVGIPKGFSYGGPNNGSSTPCECSSVYYSTLSACALCQALELDTWSDYVLNCSAPDIAVGSFPPGIPPDTSVPLWAFLNVRRLNMFDPTAAEQLADSAKDDDIVSGTAPPPSSSSSLASVTGGVSSSSSNVTVTVSASPASTSSSSDKGGGTAHKTNVGAIAGGVIGSVAFISIVAAGALFIIKRRQNDVQNDGSLPKSPKPFQSDNTRSSIDGETRTTTSVSPSGGPSTLPLMQPKLYDPSDPSTFPEMSAPMFQQYGIRNQAKPPPVGVSGSGYYHGPNYRGIPEI